MMTSTYFEIPEELRNRPQWVLWREEHRGNKPTKVPYTRNGVHAKSTEPTYWSTFADVMQKAETYSGVGYVFSPSDQYFGIDLDACRDPETGVLTDWAQKTVDLFCTYAEVSPSGYGVKLIGRGKIPDEKGHVKKLKDVATFGTKEPEVAVFDRGRFFAMTGQNINGTQIADCQPALDKLYARLWAPKPKKGTDTKRATDTPPDSELEALVARCAAAPVGQRSEADFGLCCVAVERSWDKEAVWNRVQSVGKFADRGRPYFDATWEKADQRTEPKDFAAGVILLSSAKGRTDVANSKRLEQAFGDKVRYVAPWNKWLLWDGRRWQIDNSCAVERMAIGELEKLWDQFAAEAKQAETDTVRQMLTFVRRSQDKGRAADTLRLLRSFVAVAPKQLDANPNLFNVVNGTIDLRTGKLRDHNPADLITKLSPCRYDLDADCPLWRKFVAEVFRGDDTIARYVQRVAGYSLTGEIKEHMLAFLFGTGSNGKSTLLELLLTVFGDYGMKANAEMLLTRKHDAHPTERADLFGKRLVVAVEADAGRRFAEAVMKELTGGDRIRARRMREDFWEFEPSHTVWLAANHKPVVRGTDDGFWRRIKLVPFLQQWDSDGSKPDLPAADKHLIEKLRGELDGILTWLLLGLTDWQASGVQTPQAVIDATNEYRRDSDLFGQFIAECCEVRPDVTGGASDLYQAYVKWCDESRLKPVSQTAFGRELGSRGFESTRESYSRRKAWKGIDLRR